MVRLTASAVSNERVSAKGTNSLSPFGLFRPEPPTPNYLSHGYTAHNLKLKVKGTEGFIFDQSVRRLIKNKLDFSPR